jgi:uncharacterized protein (TIGR02145 family)
LDYTISNIADTGDYYLEFNDACEMQYVDITVVNVYPNQTPANEIKGRVFSKSWQWYQNGNNLSAALYIYSDDGIVTASEFSNMQIGRGTFYANSTGCYDNLTPEENRKSRHRNVAYPQYKIFLNPPDPDPNCYPSGNYGVMTALPEMYPDPALPCTGAEIIKVAVNKTGNVTIKLTFPAPYTEKTFNSLQVTNGINFINWDGRDGSGPPGVLIPDMTNVTVKVTYINGLTNMPLFDIENNLNGIKVTLIRPTGASIQNPYVFWDDSEIHEDYWSNGFHYVCTGTTSPVDGCNPVPPPPDPDPKCHNWDQCIGEGTTAGQDHGNTINTWWYSASTSEETINPTHSALPPDPVPTNGARCGPGTIDLSVSVLPGEIAEWYTSVDEVTPFQTGTAYTTPFLAATTTYYVSAKNTFGCYSANRTPVIATINSFPALPVAGNNSRCGNGTVTISATAAPTEEVRWYLASTGGASIFTGTFFTTPFLSATTSYFAEAFNTANGCGSLSRTEVIAEIVTVPAVSNTIRNEGICSGSSPTISLQSTPAGASFTWSAANPDGRVNGYSAAGGGNLTSEVLNINTGVFQPGVVTYTVTPTRASCTGIAVPFVITVKPFPDLTISPAATSTICSGAPTNIPLSSQVLGTTFNWSAAGYSGNINPPPPLSGLTNPIAQTFSNSGNTIEPVTFSIIPTASGCTSPATLFDISVNPVPHLTNPLLSKTICSSSSANISLLFDVAGTNFTWSHVVTAGSVTVNDISPQPGLLIDDLLVNTGNIDGIVKYTITPRANNCDGPQMDFFILIHPVASVGFPDVPENPQIICSGKQTQPVPLSSNVTSLTVDYSWTVSCEPFIPTCPADANGPAIPQATISNTDLAPRYVTYSITPSVAGCDGTVATYQVQVNPSPTVNTTPLSQEICSGASSALVVLTANVTPTTFEWTSTASSGAISGYLTGPVTGDISAQTISNSSAAQGYVDYHIIPSSQSGMSCPGAAADYRIYVNPLPTPLISGPQQVCYDQSGTVYSTPAVANHDYIWTVTGANSFSGDNTSSINVDWGSGPSGTVKVTEYDLNHPTHCSTETPVRNIIIHPAPNPSFMQGAATVCQGTTGVLYQTQPGMSDYIWTVSAGGTATSGGTQTSQSVTVSWNSAGSQSVSVNYTNSNGCAAVNPTVYKVTVNSLPVSTISEGPGPSCQSQSHIYQIPADPACTFTWSIIPPASGTITSGQGTNSVTINWQTSGTATVASTATNNITSCFTSSIFPVLIHPSPLPSFTSCFDVKTTSNAKKFTLRGGAPYLPGQGVYSGSRVSLNAVSGLYEFDPFGAGPGAYPITYTFTNNYGCITSIPAVTINVVSSSFSCGGDLNDVRDGKRYQTASIGGKCWMKENLSYGAILTPSTQPQTDNCISEKYCLPSDPACTAYGGLYQWDELMAYSTTSANQGLCPPDWHVPSETEWQSMINAISIGILPPADGVAGSFMKDALLNPGFMSVTKGISYLNSDWAFTSGTLTGTMYWTSTPDGSDRSMARGVNSINPSASRYTGSRENAFSIRCVKDL